MGFCISKAKRDQSGVILDEIYNKLCTLDNKMDAVNTRIDKVEHTNTTKTGRRAKKYMQTKIPVPASPIGGRQRLDQQQKEQEVELTREKLKFDKQRIDQEGKLAIAKLELDKQRINQEGKIAMARLKLESSKILNNVLQDEVTNLSETLKRVESKVDEVKSQREQDIVELERQNTELATLRSKSDIHQTNIDSVQSQMKEDIVEIEQLRLKIKEEKSERIQQISKTKKEILRRVNTQSQYGTDTEETMSDVSNDKNDIRNKTPASKKAHTDKIIDPSLLNSPVNS